MSRPEHTAPPELFYDEKEAKKYTESSRIIHIQNQLTTRALELLARGLCLGGVLDGAGAFVQKKHEAPVEELMNRQ